MLGKIYKLNYYCNNNSVREIINKVDTREGSTASIEGQALNVQSQQRNKKSMG